MNIPPKLKEYLDEARAPLPAISDPDLSIRKIHCHLLPGHRGAGPMNAPMRAIDARRAGPG
jgi:hypothetical protein